MIFPVLPEKWPIAWSSETKPPWRNSWVDYRIRSTFSPISAAPGFSCVMLRSPCSHVLEVLVGDPGLYVAEVGVQVLALVLSCLDGEAGQTTAPVTSAAMAMK